MFRDRLVGEIDARATPRLCTDQAVAQLFRLRGCSERDPLSSAGKRRLDSAGPCSMLLGADTTLVVGEWCYADIEIS